MTHILNNLLETISQPISIITKKDGVRIPAGTNINILIDEIHRSEQHYPNPDEFIPERFTLENSKDRHKYAFIPFSAGHRNCIGILFFF